MTYIIIALFLSLFIVLIVLVQRMFNQWMQYKERNWAFQLKSDNNKALSTLRITAYERVIIMLERISPTSLVMRQNITGSSAAMLQLELMRSVREEFEHNISLQLYVSDDTWEKVRNAKDEVLELIKEAFLKVKPESAAIDLSREIFKLEASTNTRAIKTALDAIRAELESKY